MANENINDVLLEVSHDPPKSEVKRQKLIKCVLTGNSKQYLGKVYTEEQVNKVITRWEKLLDSDWLRHCEFIRNLRANSVIRGKLQISRAKSVIHSECKYRQELRTSS